jgi:hypothetical protein
VRSTFYTKPLATQRSLSAELLAGGIDAFDVDYQGYVIGRVEFLPAGAQGTHAWKNRRLAAGRISLWTPPKRPQRPVLE